MNELTLTSEKRTFTNSDITAEKFSLNESLCSSNSLAFGSCEANTIEIQVRCSEPLISEVYTVAFKGVSLGDFMVIEDKPTANKCYRDLTLVDKMYQIVNADMTNWYNALSFPMTLETFRNAFFAYLGIEQVSISLPMDYLTLSKLNEVEVITGQTIITSICQINGCFGTINNNSQFEYIWLESMIVPSETLYPSEDLYPGMSRIDVKYSKSKYNKCIYEDYEVEPITGVVIVDNQNETAAIVGEGNLYTISDNFLLYGKTGAECQEVAESLLPIISDICFVPVNVDALGNIDMQLGNFIEIVISESKSICTFVLQRTLSGIQSLHDSIVSDCQQFVSENQNTLSTAIKYMKVEQEKDSMRIGTLEADHVSVSQLNASNARIGTLEAEDVVIKGNLEAQNARVATLEADHVSVSQLNAANAKISNLETDKLSTSNLYASLANLSSVRVKYLDIDVDEFRMNGGHYRIGLKTITQQDGTQVTVLALL